MHSCHQNDMHELEGVKKNHLWEDVLLLLLLFLMFMMELFFFLDWILYNDYMP